MSLREASDRSEQIWRSRASGVYSGSVTTRVGGETTSVPNEYALKQNCPNPFNPATTIGYTVPSRSHVILSVFNILGQTVAQLVNGDKEPGSYNVTFDGSALSSGVCLYRLQAGKFVQTKTLVLLK